MDLTVLNLAIPSLTTDLKPTAAQLLWIVDIYGFLSAGALLIMGALGDRIGRRRLLLIGSGAFAFVSLFAAFSRSAAMLIVARGALGIAGATLAPSTLSLVCWSLSAACARCAGRVVAGRGARGLAAPPAAPSTSSVINNRSGGEGEKAFAVSVGVSSFSLGGARGPRAEEALNPPPPV